MSYLRRSGPEITVIPGKQISILFGFAYKGTHTKTPCLTNEGGSRIDAKRISVGMLSGQLKGLDELSRIFEVSSHLGQNATTDHPTSVSLLSHFPDGMANKEAIRSEKQNKNKEKARYVHFNEDPVTEVRSSSPVSSVSSLAPSPGASTPPPLPDVVFSSPKHSPSHIPIPPYPSPLHPGVYTSSSVPQEPQLQALPYIPLTPVPPREHLHTALVAPSLQYDLRYQPTSSNPQLSLAVLAEPASVPPLPYLSIRVAGLPSGRKCVVRPVAPGGAVVTVQDVLTTLCFHFRTQAKEDEYDALGKARRADIFRAFERRVGNDPAERGKGLRRIDFLGGRIAQGLVRGQSKDDVWDLVVR